MRKKEVIETKIGSFVDVEGLTRQYVIAAVSEAIPEENEFGDTFQTEVTRWTDEEAFYVDTVVKKLSIGFAICSKDDKFDEAIGKEIAIGKARKRPSSVIYATTPGVINSLMVDAVMKQEMSYFEANPSYLIAAYKKLKRK